MNQEIVLFIVTLIILIFASLVDLKKREVPDYLSYGLVFLGLGIRTIYTFNLGINYLLEGLLGLTIFFLISFVLYQSGQWGGGDSKLLWGMGVIIGFNYGLLLFFLTLLFVGAIFGLGWLIYLTLKNKNKVVKLLNHDLEKHYYLHYSTFVLMLIFLILGIFYHYLFFLLILLIFLVYLFKLILISEDLLFLKKVKTEDLVEGDWVINSIFRPKKKKISLYDHINTELLREGQENVKESIILAILKDFKLNKLAKKYEHYLLNVKITPKQLAKKLKVDPELVKSKKLLEFVDKKKLEEKYDYYYDKYCLCKADGTGLSSLEIENLKNYDVKSVTVREGIPLVPSFFIAYLILTVGSSVYSWVIATLF